MCGRIAFYDDTVFKADYSKSAAPLNDRIGKLLPSYNTAPSQAMAAVLNNNDYLYTHFGLIPHWAKDRKFQPINARAETLAEKPTFSKPFKTKRCLIPVNGFYEWKRDGKHKIPYWISHTETNYFALAGIYDEWIDKATEETVISTAIITTVPNAMMKPIHDRMPVILQPKDWALWLDADVQESEAIQPLLLPYESDLMRSYEVSTFVNAPANNTKQCIQPMKNSLL